MFQPVVITHQLPEVEGDETGFYIRIFLQPGQSHAGQVIFDLIYQEPEGLLAELHVVVHLDHGGDGGGVTQRHGDGMVGGRMTGIILRSKIQYPSMTYLILQTIGPLLPTMTT